MRIQAWLIAAILVNLGATVGGFVVDQYADGGIPSPLRLALLVANFACLVVFTVKWWRWRPPTGAGTG